MLLPKLLCVSSSFCHLLHHQLLLLSLQIATYSPVVCATYNLLSPVISATYKLLSSVISAILQITRFRRLCNLPSSVISATFSYIQGIKSSYFIATGHLSFIVSQQLSPPGSQHYLRQSSLLHLHFTSNHLPRSIISSNFSLVTHLATDRLLHLYIELFIPPATQLLFKLNLSPASLLQLSIFTKHSFSLFKTDLCHLLQPILAKHLL